MTWKIQDRHFSFTEDEAGGWIMGILNVTPDSFSDGGTFLAPAAALQHAREMIAAGAKIIDVGGESSRPGAAAVTGEEEIRRVIPVIEAIRAESDVLLSVDTTKPAVARAALAAGANILNDIAGFRSPEMLELLATTDAGAVCMHMQGTPATMQMAPAYSDVVGEVRAFFVESLAIFEKRGIDPARIAFDPGIGFGKSVEHNLSLLRNLALLRVGQHPMLVGVSRKSFLSKIVGERPSAPTCWPTVALTAWCRSAGVEIMRVHDVLPNAQALQMMEAIHG